MRKCELDCGFELFKNCASYFSGLLSFSLPGSFLALVRVYPSSPLSQVLCHTLCPKQLTPYFFFFSLLLFFISSLSHSLFFCSLFTCASPHSSLSLCVFYFSPSEFFCKNSTHKIRHFTPCVILPQEPDVLGTQGCRLDVDFHSQLTAHNSRGQKERERKRAKRTLERVQRLALSKLCKV